MKWIDPSMLILISLSRCYGQAERLPANVRGGLRYDRFIISAAQAVARTLRRLRYWRWGRRWTPEAAALSGSPVHPLRLRALAGVRGQTPEWGEIGRGREQKSRIHYGLLELMHVTVHSSNSRQRRGGPGHDVFIII